MHLFCSMRADEVRQDRSDDEHSNTVGVPTEGRTIAETPAGSRRRPSKGRGKDPSNSIKTSRSGRVVQGLQRSTAHGHHSESKLSAQHERANRDVSSEGRRIDPMVDGWDFVLARVADAIKKTKGNRRLAAELLGVSERKIYRWIAKNASKNSHHDMSVMSHERNQRKR
jgi:hypothetical protein